MFILGRMVHQIRQRGIDGARLRGSLRGEGGLEHEDVLLPAGRLQFRPFVDSVERRVLRPGDHADGPRGLPKPSWLIRRPARRRIRATTVTGSCIGPSITKTGRDVTGSRTLHLVLHTICAGTIEKASCERMSRRRRR